jgi:hypothetical protein
LEALPRPTSSFITAKTRQKRIPLFCSNLLFD